MIKVIYYREHYRVTVDGHASSGEAGHDLVCAGASTLVYTLAANVGNLESAGRVRSPVVNLAPGRAEVSCRPKGKYEAVVRCILNAVCVGFELMADQYPEYIAYEIHG